MALQQNLENRSGNQCELCSSINGLTAFSVYPYSDEDENHNVLVCETCNDQLNNPDRINVNHWRGLNDSIWNEADAVKVVSWRMLDIFRNNGEGWAADLQDMMYMDEATEAWAKDKEGSAIVHIDSNGAVLSAGDSVVLIKDLDVKGSSLTAKRGTAVRNIRLDPDHAEYIEGKVEGQQIVIITKFVKKSN
jgi:protein PhnA